jgi:hypothetical protein
MAVGKEIKVILTLDDSGFSSKNKAAREAVQLLGVEFGNIAKKADAFEANLADISKVAGALPKGFSNIEKVLASMDARLGTVIERLTGVSKSARSVAKDVEVLNNELTPVQRALEGIGTRSVKAATDIAALKPSLMAAKAGFKEFDQAQVSSAKVAKETATSAIDARMAVLKNEIKSNEETIASRAKMYERMRALENESRARAMVPQMRADDAVRRLGPYGSKNVVSAAGMEAAPHLAAAETARQEMQALDQVIPKLRQEQEARRANVAALEVERAAVIADTEAKRVQASIASYVGKKNAAEVERVLKDSIVRQKGLDRERDASARESANQRIRYEREVAEATRTEANATAGVIKGIVGMWGAAKVEKGLATSVDKADQMERQHVMVSALGLGKGEEDQLYASSAKMAKNLQFISQLDAIKSRMSAIASIGYNNADMIDKTLASAVKASNNLQYLGVAHGDQQSMIRNLYGVTEMRQQTADPEASNRTFELVQKIITGTAGKVQTQDLETVMRRLGAGSSQLSDQGMVKIAAIIDQFKVAGGDHGGSGGGVSTVGTMIKMFQSYAMGKGLSDTAVKELSGAGVMNTSGINFKQDKAGAFKDAKHAGFKNADLWMNDPVAAMQAIMPDIIAYTQRNKGQFYQGRDVNDAENQMNAVTMYLQRMGITQTAIAGFITAGDPRSKDRIDHQTNTINNSKGIDQVNAEMAKTYGQNVTVVKKELEDIGILVGNGLLPPLIKVLGVVKDILDSFREFASNNPMETQILGIGTAVTALAIGASALLSMFGAGGITGAIAGMGTAAAAAVPTLMGWLGGMTGATGAVLGSMRFLGAYVLKLGGWVAGAAFAGAMGWAMGTWLKDVQVGGISIQQHLENTFLDIELNFRSTIADLIETWHKFKAAIFLGDAGDAAADAERRAEIKALAGIRHKSTMSDKDAADYKAPRGAAAAATIVGNARAAEAKRAGSGFAAGQPFGGHHAGSAGGGLLQNGPGKKAKIDHVNPLDRSIGEMEGKVASGLVKVQALRAGAETLNVLMAEAAAEVEGKRVAGDYNQDHDKGKPVKADDPRIKHAINLTFQMKLQAEQAKSLTFANERLAAAQQESGDAMSRLTEDSASKQTDAFRALNRELVRAEIRLGAGAAAFDAWNTAKNTALFERASADLANFSADMIESNRAEGASFLPTEGQRTKARFDASDKKEQDSFNTKLKNMTRTRDLAIQATRTEMENARQSGDDRVNIDEKYQEKIAQINKKYEDQADRERAIQTTKVQLEGEKRARALETPMTALARQWLDTDKELNSMQTNWANGFVSMITNTLTTGKLKFGDFVKSVLADILTLKLKQSLAGPLDDMINYATNALKNAFKDSGSGGGLGSFFSSLFGSGSGSGIDTVAAGGYDDAVATAMASFANGGVMSSLGSVSLQKYANGGIADSPQLALYGEGRMNEAYVPLPDGRSIPVTMQGGGSAPAVTVNVINQSGQQVQATQTGQRFDGKQMILDVVLTAASQPGGFRDGLKGAMK